MCPMGREDDQLPKENAGLCARRSFCWYL